MVALMLLLAGRLGADENRGIKIVEVRKIWDAAPHNAFADLERFKGGWYCAFREGRGHAGGGDYGKIRVIASSDGRAWKSVALLQNQGVDLRDAKLSVTQGGELLLNSCEYRVDDDSADIRNNTSVTYRSTNGTDWSAATQIADKGYWLWQTAKYTPAAKLPNGGDSSYAGLLWHNGLLWISYYSSHSGKTSIYLAKAKIAGLK